MRVLQIIRRGEKKKRNGFAPTYVCENERAGGAQGQNEVSHFGNSNLVTRLSKQNKVQHRWILQGLGGGGEMEATCSGSRVLRGTREKAKCKGIGGNHQAPKGDGA